MSTAPPPPSPAIAAPSAGSPAPSPPPNPAAHSRFAVPDMHCAACIAKIEGGLMTYKDVSAARVNFSTKQVAVSYDSSLGAEQILERIERLGFAAQIIADPLLNTASHANAEANTARLLRAVAVAGFGMMNIMLLSISIWSGAEGGTRDLFHMLSALIAVPVVAYSGRVFFASAVTALRHRRTNMDVPISVGILLAMGLSLYETITRGPHAYFDGAVMLLFFLLVGRVLDEMMKDRAREGISALLKQTPPGAMVVQADGTTQWTKAADIKRDMILSVAAGENLVADGVITQGKSSLDFAMLTGESEPQLCGVGDTIFAGTTNLSAPIQVAVTAVGADSSLADIAWLMEEAGQHRSVYVRVAERATRYYAPAVHSLAVLAFVGWMVAGVGVYQSLLIAVAVLIITCPCALGLAVPAAHVVASGVLLRRGVLIKDGSALERLAEANYALFDKTGTLTMGKARPQTESLAQLSATEASIALALAQASRHPMSTALSSALRRAHVHPAALDNVTEHVGEGVFATWQGRAVRLCRPQKAGKAMAVALVVDSQGGDSETNDSKAQDIETSEPTIERTIVMSDPLRPDVQETIAALRAMAIPVAMLSGDQSQAVSELADSLGIESQADARPKDKVAAIQSLRDSNKKVLMIGDGLNDGPALAAAYVSIAPASASDVGQQAADAVFLGDSLYSVALAIAIAQRTMRIVRQNFALAIGYNIFAVPLALAGLVTPLVAAIAMSSSSLIVVGNALRLRSAANRVER